MVVNHPKEKFVHRARRKIMETNAQTEVNAGTQIDYEAEYNKMVAERDSYKAEAEKQKRMKDQYATENADYKKKVEAQMSDEEKRAKEHQELLDSKASLEAEIAKLKLERDFSANGFSAEETAKLIDGNFAPKDIADIIKARVDEGVKSAKAEGTKSSTAETLLGNGTANKGEAKSDFQKHQESKQLKSTVVEL
jgi:colicin import membrane protein